jgi:hypothetical protein
MHVWLCFAKHFFHKIVIFLNQVFVFASGTKKQRPFGSLLYRKWW